MLLAHPTLRHPWESFCSHWFGAWVFLSSLRKTYYLFFLFKGPYSISGHNIATKKWTPEFCPFQEHITSTPVWVRFSKLAIEYYNDNFISPLGPKIGRYVHSDANTLQVVRGHFARVCVELDLSHPLLSKVRIGCCYQQVEYEGLHLICFHCEIVGHRKDECAQLKPQTLMVTSTYSSHSANAADSLYGEPTAISPLKSAG